MVRIPKSHPRYHSLMLREAMKQGMHDGIVHETGLIAHGRGEAFDYLLGEQTIIAGDKACKIAAVWLVLADNPVISVNGNVAVLVSKECVELAQEVSGKIEVNLFHRSERRIDKIRQMLFEAGAEKVFGDVGDAVIPGLEHSRGICDAEGIFGCDVVLVPLEDGDRCLALKRLGKTVITIDLNPLSRTAQTADVTIVDNVVRTMPLIIQYVKKVKSMDKSELKRLVAGWDNKRNLRDVCRVICQKFL